MAEKPDKSSVFTLLAVLTAVLLLTAGGAAWLQGSERSAGDPARATLAALSQSIALQASRLRSGDPGAFEALETDLAALDDARARAARVPGRRADWDALAAGGKAILAQRTALVAIDEAAANVRARTPDVVAAAEALLGDSGAPAALADFQRRALALAEGVSELRGSDAPQALADDIAESLARMLAVRDALAGRETSLDIVPLPEGARADTLAPLDESLTSIENDAGIVLDNVAAVAAVADGAGAVLEAAASLRGAVAGGGAGAAPGLIGHPWTVPGLLAAALLLVLVLGILHARSAVFERAAKV